MKKVQLSRKKKTYVFIIYTLLIILSTWTLNLIVITVTAIAALGAANALVCGEYWHWENKE